MTIVITDSHSSITQEMAKELGIMVLPMPFTINGETYYEGVDLTREKFFELQEQGADISTSQPSPAEVMDIWDKGLAQADEIVYIPLSSGLSGSCQTAQMLAQDEPYAGKVFVVDNGRVSTPLFCTVLDALDMIKDGMKAEDIKNRLEKYRAEEVIYVVVPNLDALKKGGRISPTAAFFASTLNIKPIVKFDVGPIDVYKKSRGMVKAKKELFEAIKNDLNNRFKDWYESGNYYLMTATALNDEDDKEFIEEVKAEFPGLEILSGKLSLGVCGHLGYGSIGMGISSKVSKVE